MGGIGSGQYIRLYGKPRTETQHFIDIRFMNQKGWLYPGTMGSLYWSIDGQQTGSVRYSVYEKYMVLNYKCQVGNWPWENVEQKIFFDFTVCNYGGFRYWFLCPGCGRRVCILYGAGKYFLCRHCHKLTYGSKLESKADQKNRKALKIRRKLGVDPGDSAIFKPKNMHWKKFYKLRDELLRCENFYWTEVAKKLGLERD